MKIHVFPREKLPEVVKAVYNLSYPVGMGYLHFQPGNLPKANLKAILDLADTRIQCNKTRTDGYQSSIVSMDYVLGRCCKFDVWQQEDGNLYFHDEWLHHSPVDMEALLVVTGLDSTEEMPE